MRPSRLGAAIAVAALALPGRQALADHGRVSFDVHFGGGGFHGHPGFPRYSCSPGGFYGPAYGFYSYGGPVGVYSYYGYDYPPVFRSYTYYGAYPPYGGSYQQDYSSRILVNPNYPPPSPAVPVQPAGPPAGQGPQAEGTAGAKKPEVPAASPKPAPIQATREALDREAAAIRRGDASMRAGQFRQAREAYEEALEANPRSPVARFALAHAETALGHFTAAGAELLAALRDNPGWTGSGLDLKDVFPPGKELSEVIDRVRQSADLELPPNDKGELELLLGYLLWFTGEREKARTAFAAVPAEATEYRKAAEAFPPAEPGK